MEAELDHLVWAVPDLERGVLEIERRFGASPVLGGHHPGVGTRNALFDLGDRRYFEILAPDPAQHRFTGFGRWVEGLTAPRLVTWAARTDDLDAWRRSADRAGLEPGEIRSMQRRLPDGSLLTWRLLALGVDRGGRLPFCIEWGEKHPTDDLPASACRLQHLRLPASPDDPKDAPLGQLLDALGFGGAADLQLADRDLAEALSEVPPAEVADGLVAALDTPRGRVELS